MNIQAPIPFGTATEFVDGENMLITSPTIDAIKLIVSPDKTQRTIFPWIWGAFNASQWSLRGFIRFWLDGNKIGEVPVGQVLATGGDANFPQRSIANYGVSAPLGVAPPTVNGYTTLGSPVVNGIMLCVINPQTYGAYTQPQIVYIAPMFAKGKCDLITLSITETIFAPFCRLYMACSSGY